VVPKSTANTHPPLPDSVITTSLLHPAPPVTAPAPAPHTRYSPTGHHATVGGPAWPGPNGTDT
ncbi:Hsp70 family protein, partial [Rhodococcus koreensis]